MKRRPPFSHICPVVLAGLLVAALSALAAAASEEGPRVVAVEAVLSGDTLLCDVATAGLPDERAAESMRGGLPSALDVVVELVDEEERVLVRRSVRFRIAYDLWEEIFRVRDEGRAAAERRLEDIDSLRRFLRDLSGLEVAPLAAMEGSRRYRIRAGIVSHAIAPAEKERIGDWISGGDAGTDRDADRREVSLGFGGLIRYFFGGGDEGPPEGAASSDWFRPEELRDAQD
ncbi:MAG: DUF4390 domain-containing protein [Candidatus Eisenbacteria bacterium]|nr:DUF4390 domain-containing protein [Candidatus Eisenbacteria bacterium]